MLKKLLLWASLFFALVAVLGHFYLAKRSYQLRAGLQEKSLICHINDRINCDQALLSPYAKLGEVSISSVGFAVHVLIFLLLLGLVLKFSLSSYWKNLLFYLSTLMALGSIGMAILSLSQSLYCPVCWALYGFSFLLLLSLFFILTPDLLGPVRFIRPALKQKHSYISLVGVLLISFFTHAGFINTYNLKDKEQMAQAVFKDWLAEEQYPLNDHFILQKGKGTVVLVEFADFLCSYCKKAQPVIKKFLESRPDVSFRFYTYPMDSTCNSQVAFKGSGLSCELAKALLCAKNQAWKLHDFFFEKQDEWIKAQRDDKKTQELFTTALAHIGLNKEDWTACMKDPETLKKIKLSAQEGAKAKIRGTPAFFINGKEVPSFSLTNLYKIYDYIKTQ